MPIFINTTRMTNKIQQLEWHYFLSILIFLVEFNDWNCDIARKKYNLHYDIQMWINTISTLCINIVYLRYDMIQ